MDDMDLTRDTHTIGIDGHVVEVTGETGPVEATWTLAIDGSEADRAKASGKFTLRAALDDGSEVVADIHQTFVGPTRVTFRRDGEELATRKGFVA
jgi:hypothetical protein